MNGFDVIGIRPESVYGRSRRAARGNRSSGSIGSAGPAVDVGRAGASSRLRRRPPGRPNVKADQRREGTMHTNRGGSVMRSMLLLFLAAGCAARQKAAGPDAPEPDAGLRRVVCVPSVQDRFGNNPEAADAATRRLTA